MDKSIEAFKLLLSTPANADINQADDFVIIRILSHYSSMVLHRTNLLKSDLSVERCLSATRAIADELHQLVFMQGLGYVDPILAVS